MTNVANWVEETTNTTGTGAVTLGNSVAGQTSWLQAFGAGVTNVIYSIESGNDRETGIGSYDGSSQILTRTTPVSTLVAGVYDNTSPTAINLTGTSTVRCTFNAETHEDRHSMVIFDNWAGFLVEGSTAAVDAGNTDIDFINSNKHALTGTASTTINNFSFPTPFAHYFLLIPSTITISGVTATGKQEYGTNDLTAGKAHVMSIYWDDTTAHWQTSEEP